MSRCFPFPPPNYVKTVVDAALIKSIKKETERAEKESKKLKKQEKEKKRQEKEKHRTREDRKTQEKNDDGGERHEKKNVSLFHKSAGDSNKGGDQDVEQLERSSISEEHGQAVSIQCVHDSFDSMHGSVKRKRLETPTNACNSHIGSSLRIRLSLSKQKDVGLQSGEPKPCTSGHAETHTRERLGEPKPCTSGRAEIHKRERLGEPKPCTSGHAKIRARETLTTASLKCSKVASNIPVKEPLKAVKELKIAAKMPAKEPLKSVRVLSIAAKMSAKEPLKAAKELSCAAKTAKTPAKELSSAAKTAKTPAKELNSAAKTAKTPAKEPFKAMKEHSSRAKIPDSVATARLQVKELPTHGHECRNAEDLMGSWKPLPPLQMEHAEHRGATAKIATKEPPKVVAREYANAEDLMSSWRPMQLETEHPEMDDLDWLFEGRQQRSEPDAKRQKTDSCTGLVGSGTALGPRACYLAAADILALPYVLPF